MTAALFFVYLMGALLWWTEMEEGQTSVLSLLATLIWPFLMFLLLLFAGWQYLTKGQS